MISVSGISDRVNRVASRSRHPLRRVFAFIYIGTYNFAVHIESLLQVGVTGTGESYAEEVWIGLPDMKTGFTFPESNGQSLYMLTEAKVFSA